MKRIGWSVNLQSRQFRWLRVLEDARAIAHSNVVSATQWLEHDPLREDMRRVTTTTATDGVRLLAEADDLAEGSWLRTTLAPVFDAAGRLEAASENLPAELRRYEQARDHTLRALVKGLPDCERRARWPRPPKLAG
jgi:thioredoxin-like negative regulator of GroEL